MMNFSPNPGSPANDGDAWTRKQSAALVILFASFFALLGRGTFYTSDEGGIYNTGLALLKNRSPAIAPGENIHQGKDGRYYSLREMLPTFSTIPFSVAGILLEVVLQHAPPPVAPTGGDLWGSNWVIFANVSFIGPMLAALILLLVHASARQDGAGRSDALWLSLVAGLATPLIVYSKTLFAQLFESACLMLAFFEAIRWRKTASPRAALLLGVAWGLGFTSRAVFPAAPAFAAYLLLAGRQDWRGRIRALVLFAGPAALGLVAVGWWNRLRWGSPLDFGYHRDDEHFTASWWEGVYGLLASPGKGLFVYAPVLLLPIFFVRALWRQGRAEVLLLATITVSYLAIYGRWYDWPGGPCWGPRFLLPVIAPWIVLLHRALTGQPAVSARVFLYVSLLLGFAVQVPGLTLYPAWMYWREGDWFSLAHCYPVVLTRTLLERGPDDLWLWARSATPPRIFLAFLLLFAAGVLWGGVIQWKRGECPRDRGAVGLLLGLTALVLLGSVLHFR
jgi:hypothetical protein